MLDSYIKLWELIDKQDELDKKIEEEMKNADDIEGLENMKPDKTIFTSASNPHGFSQKERITYELLSVDS
jgi:hypothetical protein